MDNLKRLTQRTFNMVDASSVLQDLSKSPI